MYDPKVKDLGLDAFGDAHGYRGAYLIDALDRWSDDQPIGRHVTAREISQEVTRYRKFRSPDAHGPVKCARIMLTDPRWHKVGSTLIKGPQLIPARESVRKWIDDTSPGRMSAKDHAAAYNLWANLNNAESCNYVSIASHLRAAGYTIVARPNNRAIYAKTEWI